MSFKKLVIVLAFISAVLSMRAQSADSNYLHIYTNGQWVVLDLDKVDRLEFKGDNMIAKAEDNTEVASYPRTSLEVLYVDEAATTAINAAVADETAAFTFDADSKTATMLVDGSFSVYDITGRRLVEIPAVKKGETIDLQTLRPGIIILRSESFSKKVVIK